MGGLPPNNKGKNGSGLRDYCNSSPHLPDFPVVLVLGVATSINAVHQSLPQTATSLLSIEQFHTQHSALTFGQIIDKVLITHRFPFKLGPKTLKFLLHQFFYCNFSLTNFRCALKFALMEHVYWQPLSILCGKQWPRITHTFCEAVRATPSFQRLISSTEPAQRLLLLGNDLKLKAKIKELVSVVGLYHKIFPPLLLCLHHLTCDLPNAPLGKKLHELYSFSLEQDIVKRANFKSAWRLVNILSKENFCSRVSLCIQELNKATSLSTTKVKILEDTLSTLMEFTHQVTLLDADSGGQATVSSQATPVQETTVERKLRFQERQRQISSRSDELNAFEVLRNKLTDSLLLVFTEHLKCPGVLPLHEAFYFDQVTSLRQHLAPSPRAAVQTALSNPNWYFRKKCREDVTPNSKMPGICTIYQLHLECGRLINLYDWLQSFITIMEPESADKEDAKKETVNPLLQAQFIQAVSELQLLGFIKPTQRKTDHVQRLTWGSC